MFSPLDEALMRVALEEANAAYQAGEIPVGAVAARGDEIVSRARNEREASGDATSHAEILAIRRAAEALGGRRLTGLTLYVTLEPCPMCAGAVAMSGISRLVYGAKDARYGCAGSVYRLTEDPAFPSFCPADGGLCEEECARLLKRFFEARRA